MRRGTWHIFHFVGHGRFDVNQDEGMLALVSETGETDELTATQVGRLLSDHPSLRLALLNACEGAREARRTSSPAPRQRWSGGAFRPLSPCSTRSPTCCHRVRPYLLRGGGG